MKLSLTIIIVALLFLSSCSTTKWTHGTWTGVGKQIDNATWDVKLNVSDNDEFKIEYPTLSCGGTWTITGNSKSSSKTSGSGKSVTLKLMLKESIEFGTENCDQGVEVHLTQTQDPKKIKATYYLRSYDPNNPIAEAILTKQ